MSFAYVQQRPFPAWSTGFPADTAGNPTEQLYNAPANPCVDHGPANGSALSGVPAQLTVTLDRDDGPLVRGTGGIDGNKYRLVVEVVNSGALAYRIVL